MINVAILGYGTVGSGVFEVLNENKESISRPVSYTHLTLPTTSRV